MLKYLSYLSFFLAFHLGISQINFVDRASIVGLTSETGTTPFGGNGVSFADFDNDGFDDITLASAGGVPLRFYKNIDGLVFVEQFLLPPTDSYDYRTRSINWVDIDNDGDRDLFLTSDTDGNRLFENQNGILSDITVIAGFPLDNLFTYGASWGDINNDGCLDVYLSNRIGGVNDIIPNYLFQNNCDGTFSEVTETIGLGNQPALTFCSAFFDFNNDGWQDLYVANDKFKPNYLYKNNGDGTFTDVSVSSGTDIIMDAMSVTVDDFNSDGFFDIFMTNTPIGVSTPVPGCVMLKNNGDETFSNISSSSGTDLDSFTWGSSFLDADNDTDLDLYVNSQYDGSNGYSSYAFYENTGNDVFTRPDDVGFMTNWHNSYAVAVGDYNGDGFQELLVNNNGHIPSLWQNIDPTGGNYLLIDLKGNLSNADGIGSVIEISVNGNKHFRHVLCGEGYLSQNSFVEHFGLGSATEVDYVKVFWLSGVVDLITDVSANQKLTISEGSTLSISDQQALDVAVYPNPTTSEFVIESKVLLQEIEIYNSTGKQIMAIKPKSTKVSIDISPFQTGFILFGLKQIQ
jgi:hypothetical protein